MLEGIIGKVIGTVATVVVAGGVAAATVLGLVSSQVNSAAESPGNAENPAIDYGANG